MTCAFNGVIFWLEIRGSGFRGDMTASNEQQHPLTWARGMTNEVTCSAEEQVCWGFMG